MMVKNFMFYAFSTFVNTWSSQKGSATVFRTFGIVTLCLMFTCIPMCKCCDHNPDLPFLLLGG